MKYNSVVVIENGKLAAMAPPEEMFIHRRSEINFLIWVKFTPSKAVRLRHAGGRLWQEQSDA